MNKTVLSSSIRYLTPPFYRRTIETNMGAQLFQAIRHNPFWPAALAFLLGFAGSYLYIYGKIGPLHIGLPFCLLAIFLFILNSDSRKTALLTIFNELFFLAPLLLIHFFVIHNFSRFTLFLTYFIIGYIYFVLGKVWAYARWPIHSRLIYFLIIFWLSAITFRLVFPTQSPYPPFGGAYGNVNDMATALTALLLIQYIYTKKTNLLLSAAVWSYTALLDRRAAMVALLLFFIFDLTAMKSRPSFLRRFVFYAALVASTLSLSSQRGLNAINFDNGKIVARSNSGDGERIYLFKEMVTHIAQKPLVEKVFGSGLGQATIASPRSSMASPHLFWLEMYMYLGIAWFIWIAHLFFKSGKRGKYALLTFCLVGISMSSMIYFIPFYFLAGFISTQEPENKSLKVAKKTVPAMTYTPERS